MIDGSSRTLKLNDGYGFRCAFPRVVVELYEAPDRFVIVTPRASRHVDDLILGGEETELDRAHSAAVAALKSENHVAPFVTLRHNLSISVGIEPTNQWQYRGSIPSLMPFRFWFRFDPRSTHADQGE